MGNIALKGPNNKTEENINIKLDNEILPDFHFLTNWRITDIRKLIEHHIRHNYSILLDLRTFRSIFKLLPSTAKQIFSKFSQEDSKICFYEVIAPMVLYGYLNSINKITFLFNLFNFEGEKTISKEEMFLLITALVRGVYKFTQSHMITVDTLRKVSFAVYASAEYNSFNKLTILELLSWVEVNQDIEKVLTAFEPLTSLKENYEDYLPFYKNQHLINLFFYYKDKIPKDKNSEIETIFRMSKFQKSNLSLPNINKSVQLNQSSSAPGGLDVSQKMKKVLKAAKTDVISINGMSVTKKQVLQFKENFDNMNKSKNGKLILEEFIESCSNIQYLKRIANSLFKFMDKNKQGYIDFKQFLRSISSGITKNQLNIMLKWVQEQEDAKVKAHYIEKHASRLIDNEEEVRQALQLRNIKDILYCFVRFDNENKGYLNLSDFETAFSKEFKKEELKEQFDNANISKTGKLSLKEYLHMMLPKNYYISEEVLLDQVEPYVKRLRALNNN